MNPIRYEVDARYTPKCFGFFKAFEGVAMRREAFTYARSLRAQGFGWIRVQQASVYVDDTTPRVVAELGGE